MPFHHHTLPNGLTIIGETNPSAKSAALGFFVRTGARDESPELAGVSHFLEHMVFKGTPRRSARAVNLDLDRIGSKANAFTSEENTVFYAGFLPEYLEPAVDVLADILRPSLRADDFDTEKKVIIEEIGMYDDQPDMAAYEQARKHYFGPHPLGNSVLGTAESITALTRDQMEAYFRRRYAAPNITVAAAGQFEFKKLIGLVELACGAWQRGEVPRPITLPAGGSGAVKVSTRATVTQEYGLLISAAPAADSPLRHAADALTLAVGDDSGSRLYWELVDPGLAEDADMRFYESDGAGSFFTGFNCAPERAGSNLDAVRRVLSEVQAGGITAEELTTAKNKIGSRVVRSAERPMGRMQALGMSWTYLKEYRSVDDELKSFDDVTVESVREVLERYPVDNPTGLLFGPLERV